MVVPAGASRMMMMIMMMNSDLGLVALLLVVLTVVDLAMGLTRPGGCVLLLRDIKESAGTGYL
jgi:hypothetical protein